MKISSVTDNRVSKINIPETVESIQAQLPIEQVEDEKQRVVVSKNEASSLENIFEKEAGKTTQSNVFLQTLAPEWNDQKTNLENIKLSYPHWFNIITVSLHALGASLPSIPFIPEKISKGFRSAAENFSRWCIPISKVHNAYEAFQGARVYDGIAKALPALLIPALRLPFHNFQLAYGLGSGINVVQEHIKSRVGGLSKKDGWLANVNKINQGFVHAVKDLFYGGEHVTGSERTKLGLTLGGGAAMLLGAIPTLIFDRNGLNDTFARIFGSIRSLGGLLGDLSITIFPSNPIPELKKKEPIIGGFYLVPTFMDFAQRWMNQNEETNAIFNHFKATLNTIAELIWTHFSTIETQKEKEKSAINQTQNLDYQILHAA